MPLEKLFKDRIDIKKLKVDTSSKMGDGLFEIDKQISPAEWQEIFKNPDIRRTALKVFVYILSSEQFRKGGYQLPETSSRIELDFNDADIGTYSLVGKLQPYLDKRGGWRNFRGRLKSSIEPPAEFQLWSMLAVQAKDPAQAKKMLDDRYCQFIGESIRKGLSAINDFSNSYAIGQLALMKILKPDFVTSYDLNEVLKIAEEVFKKWQKEDLNKRVWSSFIKLAAFIKILRAGSAVLTSKGLTLAPPQDLDRPAARRLPGKRKF